MNTPGRTTDVAFCSSMGELVDGAGAELGVQRVAAARGEGHAMSNHDGAALTVAAGEDCVVVAGELDMATSVTLVKAIDKWCEGEARLDFERVTFMDSAGLRCLLRVAHDRRVVLVNTSDEVTRLLELMNVTAHFQA